MRIGKAKVSKIIDANILLIILACLPTTFNSQLKAGFIYFLQGKSNILYKPLHNVTVIYKTFVTKVTESICENKLHFFLLLRVSFQENLVKTVFIVEDIK